MATTYSSGVVTAYGAAVQAGYTGTYEEFSVLMAALPVEVSRLQNMTVVVNILPKGSSPSASYENGVLTLNIPNGGITEDELNDALENKADIIISSASGSHASFPDGANDLPMESLQAEITPMQNLNGYSKPWAAGAGKNKLNNVLTTTTSETVTFATQPDGSVLVVSSTPPTASAYAYLMPSGFSLPEGTYILSGCPAGGGSNSYDFRIKLTTNGTTQTKYDYGSGVTFTVESGTVIDHVRIVIKANYDASAGLTFWPMIRLASVADDSYEPYSNICPITGLTGLSVYVSPTNDVDDATSYAVDWTSAAGTVYGGTVSLVTGKLTSTMANIASYNGETIGEPWLSSMDEFVSGTTPTTGAQVVYTLATPVTHQLTAQEVNSLLGQNYVWSTSGNVAVSYRADTKLYIDNKITQAIAAALNA